MYKTFDEALKDLKEKEINYTRLTIHHIVTIDKRLDFYTKEEIEDLRLQKVYSSIGFKLLQEIKFKRNFLCFPSISDEIDDDDVLKTLFKVQVIIFK